MRLAHPGLAAGVDVAPAAAAELVPGPRPEASRRSGIGAAATDRGVEPDVLPTAGVRLADRTRTFTPPAPGDLSTPSKSRGHASPKTTKLYDRTADTVTVDEIERIVIDEPSGRPRGLRRKGPGRGRSASCPRWRRSQNPLGVAQRLDLGLESVDLFLAIGNGLCNDTPEVEE